MEKQVPEHLLIEAYNAILDAYQDDALICNYCDECIVDEEKDHDDDCILLKARQFSGDLMKAHIEEIESKAHYYDGV